LPGKVDWLAHNLPVEGERTDPPTAGRLLRADAVRCGPDDAAADALAAIEASPYSFALVTGSGGTLLGRARESALAQARDGTVEAVMELDPSTVRPHSAAGELAERLAEQDLRWAIVTTPEGRLLGVAWWEDLERAAADP
jgi:CBS-domain-containing membrane protein